MLLRGYSWNGHFHLPRSVFRWASRTDAVEHAIRWCWQGLPRRDAANGTGDEGEEKVQDRLAARLSQELADFQEEPPFRATFELYDEAETWPCCGTK